MNFREDKKRKPRVLVLVMKEKKLGIRKGVEVGGGWLKKGSNGNCAAIRISWADATQVNQRRNGGAKSRRKYPEKGQMSLQNKREKDWT